MAPAPGGAAAGPLTLLLPTLVTSKSSRLVEDMQEGTGFGPIVAQAAPGEILALSDPGCVPGDPSWFLSSAEPSSLFSATSKSC